MKSGYDAAQGVRIRYGDVKGFKELDIYDNNHRSITSEDNTFYSLVNPKNKQVFITPSIESISRLNIMLTETFVLCICAVKCRLA